MVLDRKTQTSRLQCVNYWKHQVDNWFTVHFGSSAVTRINFLKERREHGWSRTLQNKTRWWWRTNRLVFRLGSLIRVYNLKWFVRFSGFSWKHHQSCEITVKAAVQKSGDWQAKHSVIYNRRCSEKARSPHISTLTRVSDLMTWMIWLSGAQSVAQEGKMEPYHLMIWKQKVKFSNPLCSAPPTSLMNIRQE